MADAPRVTPEELRHVAALARLGLSEERAADLTRDLNTILTHMDVLGRVNTEGVTEATATTGGMRLRDDRGPPEPLREPPEAFVPAMREGFIQVPRLETHEDAESA